MSGDDLFHLQPLAKISEASLSVHQLSAGIGGVARENGCGQCSTILYIHEKEERRKVNNNMDIVITN